MKILNLQAGAPFSMGKGKNWSVVNPELGARLVTLNHGLHSAGNEFTQHRHEESEDVIVVLEGWVHLRQGQLLTPLEAGEAALVPPGEVHGTVNSSGAEARLISFQLPPDPALYRGERDRREKETPQPPEQYESAVQIATMSKGSPRFPSSPLVRNVFSPPKGSTHAILDWIRLERNEALTFANKGTETVLVLIQGTAELSHDGETSPLDTFAVLFLNDEETVSIGQTGQTQAVLLRCSSSSSASPLRREDRPAVRGR